MPKALQLLPLRPFILVAGLLVSACAGLSGEEVEPFPFSVTEAIQADLLAALVQQHPPTTTELGYEPTGPAGEAIDRALRQSGYVVRREGEAPRFSLVVHTDQHTQLLVGILRIGRQVLVRKYTVDSRGLTVVTQSKGT